MAFFSCTNDIEEGPEESPSNFCIPQINDPVVKAVLKPSVSEREFTEKIQGRGWLKMEGHELDPTTSKLAPNDFFRDSEDENGKTIFSIWPIGISFEQPLFKQDKLILFFGTFPNEPCRRFLEKDYVFDEATSSVWMKGEEECKFPRYYIAKVDGDNLYTIEAYDLKGATHYIYLRYRPMTTEEETDYLTKSVKW